MNFENYDFDIVSNFDIRISNLKMGMTKKILIVAGEPSGDLHAGRLVNNLKNLDPDLRFFGMGGSLLKNAGADISFDISKLALVGLVEVWKNIFTVGKVYKGLLKRIDAEKPDMAILVDYPGFNLRLAKELKKRSIPVIYYISPQVWVWGRNRVNIIRACVKKILVFFKFEEELYRACGIDAGFVGHPSVDTVRADRPKDETLKAYGLSSLKRTIALLPGSRAIEVKRLLPIMVDAAGIINSKTSDTQFIIAKYPDLPASLYEDALKNSGLGIKIGSGDTYNILAASDFAIVASGTATLETAIIGTPLIIVYTANLLTYIVYKFVATIKFVGIVNIIAGREIAPEFLQYEATPVKIAEKAVSILSDAKTMEKMREELRGVKNSLGEPGASMRAAKIISQVILSR